MTPPTTPCRTGRAGRSFSPTATGTPPDNPPAPRHRPGPPLRPHPCARLAVGGGSLLRQPRLRLPAPAGFPPELPGLRGRLLHLAHPGGGSLTIGRPCPLPQHPNLSPYGTQIALICVLFFHFLLTPVLICLILYLFKQYSKKTQRGVFTLGHRRQQQGQPPAVRADRRPNQRGHPPGGGQGRRSPPLHPLPGQGPAHQHSHRAEGLRHPPGRGLHRNHRRERVLCGPQNQDFYLEEQQKKIEEKFAEAITIARASGISLEKLTDLLSLMYEEDE